MSGVVDFDDIIVMEFGDGFSFAFETFGAVWLGGEVWVEEFESDGPVETGIDGAVNDSHSAASNFLFDDIAFCYELSVERCQCLSPVAER